MAFTHIMVSEFLTKEECNIILDFSLKELELVPSKTFSDYTNGNVNTSIRESNQVFYPYYEKFPFLLEKMSKLLNQYIFVKGFDLNFKKSEFQFTQYYPGGHFDWHKDTTEKKIADYDRYCSLVIQLNDEYEDGDLELKLSDDSIMKVEKGIGNTIVFLSNIEHRVTGVKSGNRYTLVNWVGITEKNNYKKTLL